MVENLGPRLPWSLSSLLSSLYLQCPKGYIPLQNSIALQVDKSNIRWKRYRKNFTPLPGVSFRKKFILKIIERYCWITWMTWKTNTQRIKKLNLTLAKQDPFNLGQAYKMELLRSITVNCFDVAVNITNPIKISTKKDISRGSKGPNFTRIALMKYAFSLAKGKQGGQLIRKCFL